MQTPLPHVICMHFSWCLCVFLCLCFLCAMHFSFTCHIVMAKLLGMCANVVSWCPTNHVLCIICWTTCCVNQVPRRSVPAVVFRPSARGGIYVAMANTAVSILEQPCLCVVLFVPGCEALFPMKWSFKVCTVQVPPPFWHFKAKNQTD